MNRTTSAKPFALVSLAFAAVCAFIPLAGCGRVSGQFIIIQNQVPQSGCTFSSDVSSLYRPEGVLDVFVVDSPGAGGYRIFPLLENDLPGLAMGQLVNGNRIALSDWHVSLQPLGSASAAIQAFFADPGNAQLVDYFRPTSGSVDSGGGHTASDIEAFPAELARRISTGSNLLGLGESFEVEATIHALGNTLNGSIQSDDFRFPISVCNGCLVGTTGMCPFHVAATNAGNPCNAAQDQIVDCCSIGTALQCPPTVGQ